MVLSYGVSGYVLLKFMIEMFEAKYKKGAYVVSWALFVGLSILLNMSGLAFIKSIYGILSACVIGIILFKAKNKKRIVGVAIFFFLYLFMIDTLSVLFFTVFSGKTIETVRSNIMFLFICGLGNQIMLLCCYKPIVSLMKKHKFDTINAQQNLFLIILALFEILLLIYIMSFIDRTSSGIVLTIMMLGFLGLDIYLIYLFETISQKHELEKEMDLREQQELMQTNYYHSLEMQYDHSRRLIHDMKNHMQTLEELYNSGSGVEAKKYTKTIVETVDRIAGRFKCRNRTLTIIINDKILKCDEYAIGIDLEVEDIDFEFMEPFDITTIFSNLLDNAIEACSRLKKEERIIKIRVFKFKDFLTINIYNKYDGSLIWDKSNLVSTKDGKHMGLGIKNVQSAIVRYDGTLKIQSSDNYFDVKILLSLKN